MKKIVNGIKNLLVIAITLIAVFMMVFTVVSVTMFDRNDRNLFGYRAYIVASDSMSATDFDAGDLIIVKEVDPSTLVEGDIISYISQSSESFGETITHKIRRLTTDIHGEKGFVTYGTTTNSDDPVIVTYPYVLGRYEMNIPKLGLFFSFLKTPQGYFTCIFAPFMLLILYQGWTSVRLFMRYKKEQKEELDQEKAKLQAERDEAAKMMEEIKALREQLEKKQTVRTFYFDEEDD